MFSYKANAICMAGMAMSAGAGVSISHNWNRVQNPDSSLIMHDFDLTDELSLKIELHMLRPITEKVHSGNGRVSLVHRSYHHCYIFNLCGELCVSVVRAFLFSVSACLSLSSVLCFVCLFG